MRFNIIWVILFFSLFLAACAKPQAKSAGAISPTQVKYPGKLVMYKQSDCGCCSAWADYMSRNGFEVTIVEEANMSLIRRRYKIPEELAACHTAVYGNLVIEGHVPAEDVVSLIQKPSTKVRLIAVPGMPLGSPGMEVDERKEPYATMVQTATGAVEKYREHGK
jgi:hypothetical protein